MRTLLRVTLSAGAAIAALTAALAAPAPADARELTAVDHSIAQVFRQQVVDDCVSSDVLAGAIDRTFYSDYPREESYVNFQVITFDYCSNDYVYFASPSAAPDAGYGFSAAPDALTFNPQKTEARLRFAINVTTYTPQSGVGSGVASVDVTFTRSNPHESSARAVGTVTLPDRTIDIDASYPASIFDIHFVEEGA